MPTVRAVLEKRKVDKDQKVWLKGLYWHGTAQLLYSDDLSKYLDLPVKKIFNNGEELILEVGDDECQK